MDINIRKAILHNIADNSVDQLEDTIVDAIRGGEEKTLPGLGFLFELIWQQSDDEDKIEMLQALEKGVQQANMS